MSAFIARLTAAAFIAGLPCAVVRGGLIPSAVLSRRPFPGPSARRWSGRHRTRRRPRSAPTARACHASRRRDGRSRRRPRPAGPGRVRRAGRANEDVGAFDAVLLDEMLDGRLGIATGIEVGDDGPVHGSLLCVPTRGPKPGRHRCGCSTSAKARTGRRRQRPGRRFDLEKSRAGGGGPLKLCGAEAGVGTWERRSRENSDRRVPWETPSVAVARAGAAASKVRFTS